MGGFGFGQPSKSVIQGHFRGFVGSKSIRASGDHTDFVVEILNVSYDAASRLMQKMKGVVDLGTPTRRYKRGKRKLRISGKNLLAFLRGKTKD